jgi:hypothetical protein
MNRATLSVFLSSLYFLLFLVSLNLGYERLTWALFLFSPLLLLYLVYSVIRHGQYNGKELAEDEEWGYEDLDKDKLGTWG